MQGSIKNNNVKGTTLIGMAVAVSIISLFAIIALPSFTSSESYQIDRAAYGVIQALRFAQSEAKRTGEMYGIDINRATTQVTVYKVNISTNPVSQEFIATHPIDKNQYDYNIGNLLNLPNLTISNTEDIFLYKDSIRRNSLLFDDRGSPVWFDASTSKIVHLDNASIILNLGNQSQSVIIDPYSGRVVY
ncbi:MAG: Tfp pilus assembly protein FimT/FimU [Gammaproteobacteria bacterium]